MRNQTTHRGLLAAVAAVSIGGAGAMGANINWDGGAATTNWADAANWSSDTLPGASDVAGFSNTGTTPNAVISLGADRSIATLNFFGFSNNALTFGDAADVAAGRTLTLTNVIQGASNGTRTLAANIALAASSSWDIASSTVTATGAVSGSGFSVTKWGGGTLVLTRANTYSGSTVVNAGTLTLNFNTATSPTSDILSSSSTLVMAGGTLSLGGKNQAGFTNTQTVNGLTLNAGTSAFSIVNGINTGKASLNFGAITRNAGALVNFSQPTVNTAISAQNGYTTSTANVNGILGGYATVAGNDWATNNGTNIVAYTGYTTLSGAGPSIADAAASNVRVNNTSTGNIGQGGGTTTINSLLYNDSAGRTIAIGTGNTLRLGASGGILKNGAGTLTIGTSGDAGTLTAGGTADTAGELVLNNSTAVTLNSTIADNGTGAVTLTKAGAGTVTVNAATTHTGGTFVAAGTLQLPAGANNLAPAGNITVTGGTLNLGTATQSLSGTLTISGGTLSNGTITKTGADFAVSGGTISAVLGGTGIGLTKTSPHSATLSGNNTYTGVTTVLEGALNATVSGAIDGNIVVGSVSGGPSASLNGSDNFDALPSTAITVHSNGSLRIGNGDHIGAITINGGSVSSNFGYIDDTITMTGGSLGGAVYGNHGTFNILASATTATISGNNNFNRTQTFNVADGAAAVDLNVTAALAGGANPIVKNGDGLMIITSSNGYSGSTTINKGVLSVNQLAAGGANSSIGSSTATAANLVLNGGVLQYTGAGATTDRNFTVGTTAGSGLDASGTGAIVFSSTASPTLSTSGTARTFTLAGTSTDANTLASALANAGAGATSLTKTGTGRWILSGSSTYTGATTVSDGTLQVDGVLGNTAVTVNGPNAVLGGNGTIAGNVVITDGTLAAGASIGTLTFGGNLTINDTLLVEVDGTGSGSADLIVVTGALKTLDITNAIVNFSVLGPLDDAAYVFATYTQRVGVFAPVNILNLPSGYQIDYDYLGGNQIALVTVPEPGAASLLVVAAIGLTRRRRVVAHG